MKTQVQPGETKRNQVKLGKNRKNGPRTTTVVIGPRIFRLGQSASTFYGTRRFPTFDTATRNGCCDRVLFVCLFVFCLCAYLFLGKGQTVRGQSPLAISKHDRYFNISIFGFLFRCVRFEGTVFFWRICFWSNESFETKVQ